MSLESRMKLALGVSRFIPSNYFLINLTARQGVPLMASAAHPIGVQSKLCLFLLLPRNDKALLCKTARWDRCCVSWLLEGLVLFLSLCAVASSVGVVNRHDSRRITLDIPETQRNKMRNEAIGICLAIMLTMYKVNIKGDIIKSRQQQENEPE